MAQQLVIPTVFQAIDRISPAMHAMTRGVDNFGSHAEIALARGDRAFRRVMAPMRAIGRTFNSMLGGLGAPIGIAAVGMAIKGASDVFIGFEAANSNLAAALDKTASQIVPLSNDAKRLGAITSFTAAQVSGLQFEYAKLGFSDDQILKMTESTLSLAAATNFDLGQSATTVGAAIRAYGLESKDAARVSDVLASSVSKTALDMSDLFMNMSTFAPVAKAFNFSMEDSIALFGKIRDSGFDASSAATALRNIFLNLADSNGKLARALGKPASTLPELIKGMQTLRDKGVNLAQMLELTDKRSVAAFATLLDNAGAVKTLAGELNNAEGFAKKMADTQLNNVKGSLTILKSAWEGWILSIEDGNGKIAKYIRNVADTFTDLFQIMSGTAKATTELNTHEKSIRSVAESAMYWGKMALYAAGALTAWKAILIGGRAAMLAVNVAIGIGNALFTTSTTLTYGNIVAQQAYLTTSKIVGGALEILNGNFAVLNGTMLANPAFLFVAGLAAVAGAVYFLNKENEKLTEVFQRQLNLDVISEYEKQKRVVDELTQAYVKYGFTVEAANAKAAEQKYQAADLALRDARLAKKNSEDALINAYDNALFPAFSPDVARAHANMEDAQRGVTVAQAGRAAQTNNIQSLVQSGGLNTGQAMNIFQGQPMENFKMTQTEKPKYTPANFNDQEQSTINDMNKLIASGMKLTMEVKNNSDLPVALSSAGSRAFNVQPQTKSTTTLDE